MYLFPSLVLGKGPTKSRPIRSNGLSTVIDFKRPDGFQDDGFRVWHFWLDNTWCVTCWVMLGQMKRLVSLCNVFVRGPGFKSRSSPNCLIIIAWYCAKFFLLALLSIEELPWTHKTLRPMINYGITWTKRKNPTLSNCFRFIMIA